jgi:hypothetical protein
MDLRERKWREAGKDCIMRSFITCTFHHINTFIKSMGIQWVGHVARTVEVRNVANNLDGKPEGKTPLRKPRRRWEDNIRMDLREIGWEDVDWMHLA